MKIALFHYHFRKGGVTDAAAFSVRALLRHLEAIEEIRLVCGEYAGTEEMMQRIREGLERNTADKLKLDVLEELAYTQGEGGPDPEKLAHRLEARYDGDTLWWIHNYHLGKNPAFTAAVMRIAASGRRSLLLHIHDFPECGRPENLRRLDEMLNTPPYPSGRRIRYAVINERDRRILADCGLGDAVTLLSNPVPEPPRSTQSSPELHKALTERSLGANPGYVPNAPILLYPVRAIRRKNVLEAAILARLLDEPVNLIVTLPGQSDQEKRYSDLVQRAFADGTIPGVWCPETTGDPRLTYPKLASGCDAVVSAAVQEGFGYLFLNALYWRKPLLARYLDILDGVLDMFGEYPRRFWADFRVPAAPDAVARIKSLYLEKISKEAYRLPPRAVKSMQSAAEKIDAGGGIDVSFLPVEEQLSALRAAGENKDWLEQARILNRELLDSVGRTIRAGAPDMSAVLRSRFNDGIFAKTFAGIAAGMGAKLPSPSAAKVRDSVSKAFGRLDYLRLIHDF